MALNCSQHLIDDRTIKDCKLLHVQTMAAKRTSDMEQSKQPRKSLVISPA